MNIFQNSIIGEADELALQTLQLAFVAVNYSNQQSIDNYLSLLPSLRTDGREYLAVVRKNRDTLLDASDWIVVKSLEAGVAIPSSWVTYRQALRDVPEQTGYPDAITWPTKP